MDLIVPRKRKVGIDLAPAGRLGDAPGTARHVIQQARALMKMDVPWTWVPLVESMENPLFEEMKPLVPVVVPQARTWTRALFQVGKAWQEARCNLGFATAYFVPWAGIPVVANFFDSGSVDPEYRKTWVTSGKRWNYYLNTGLSYHSLFRAHRLFIDSDFCRDKVVERFPWVAEKMVTVPCGVPQPEIRPAARPGWASSLDRPFFLYVGVFSDNKNQFRLLRAWRHLQQNLEGAPALVLIGPCGDSYKQEKIVPALAEMPDPRQVILAGKVPQEDLAWAYQNAQAYVQPSIMEGFGMPVIEAMSYGLPVACSNTTSLPETAGDAALFFDPRDEAHMASVLRDLARDPALRQSLAERGGKRWQSFTWERNARIVAKEIEETLGETG